jgi:hypothetical protein
MSPAVPDWVWCYQRGALRFCLHRKPAEQERQIFGLIEPPQRLQDGIGARLRPALADIAAELALDVGAPHRAADEARDVVDLAHDALPVGENGGDAGRHHGAVAGGGIVILANSTKCPVTRIGTKILGTLSGQAPAAIENLEEVN